MKRQNLPPPPAQQDFPANNANFLPSKLHTTLLTFHASINNSSPILCLADTGAGNFINTKLAHSLKLPLHQLRKPIPVELHDGSRTPSITHCTRITLTFKNNKQATSWFYLTKTDPKRQITLGIPWLRQNIPEAIQSISDFFNEQDEKEEEEEFVTAAAAMISTQENNHELPAEFQRYAHVFDLNYDKNPPTIITNPYFRINVDSNDLPPPQTGLPRSPDELILEERIIQEKLKLGQIQPSHSHTAVNSFFVAKQCLTCGQLRCTCQPGKENIPDKRYVRDYRQLNNKEKQDAYPLPCIPELLQQFGGKNWYIKFDVAAAFELCAIHPDDWHKTAFVTSLGLYEQKVMTFGFKNAPAHWQRLIDKHLAPVRQWCRAFMDDGILFADSRQELIDRFLIVLEICEKVGFRLKLSKCEFFKHEVKFLGYILSTNGVKTDPDKIKAIEEWPEPLTKTDIRGFNSLCSFYRNNIKNLSHTLLPLTEATKNSAPDKYEKTPTHLSQAMRQVKNLFKKEVELAIYDPTQETLITTDASSEAWGGDISQNGRPLAFISGKFSDTERGWSTTDRELYALYAIHKKFPYLLQSKTIWITDHKPGEAWHTTLANTPKRLRWRDTLDMFPFLIRYKKGKEMHVDGITRHSSYPKDAGYGSVDPVFPTDRFDANDAFTALTLRHTKN